LTKPAFHVERTFVDRAERSTWNVG